MPTALTLGRPFGVRIIVHYRHDGSVAVFETVLRVAKMLTDDGITPMVETVGF
jgi:hypothetical protein